MADIYSYMAIKKPDFITKKQNRGITARSRPYKWGPGVPSLAIQFDEIPGETKSVPQPGDTFYLLTESSIPMLSEAGSNLIV